MPKRGLPTGVKMRHDAHYVEELAQKSKTIGKIIEIDLIYPNPDQPRSEFGDLGQNWFRQYVNKGSSNRS